MSNYFKYIVLIDGHKWYFTNFRDATSFVRGIKNADVRIYKLVYANGELVNER